MRKCHIRKNLTNKIFHLLTVVKHSHNLNGRNFWVCKCECGNETVVNGKYLINGDTKSCGCIKKNIAIANGKNSATHNLTKSPLYKVWSSMKDRCLNKRCHAYKDYGGRGIKVCNEWVNSFHKFYNDVIGSYKKGLELDRIDNNGNYCKENFRWATPSQNKRNRRNSSLIILYGVEKHIFDWAEMYSINKSAIRYRYNKGLKGDDAIFGNKKNNYNGV